MTIEDADIALFESTTEAFSPQPTPTHCLPIGLKNILDDLAEQHDEPELSFSIQELEEITEYHEWVGSRSNNVAAVLGAELENIGYTVKEQMNTTFRELQEIIDRGTASYPLVELAPEYFDHIEGDWNPQPGRRGYQFPHVVTPFKVNSSKLLYYEPFGKMMVQSGRAPSANTQLDQPLFYELWTDGPHPRWTLWVEQLEQQTLQASIQRKL